MKITTRPESAIHGKGAYTVRMTYHQLELIAALVNSIRLGQHGSVYKRAAYDLHGLFDDVFDQTFMDDAVQNVDIVMSVVDDNCDPIEQFSVSEFAIEV